MARRFRVPGLLDLVRSEDPAEIRALNEESRIDRHFVSRGPLVNRLIAARIRRWFQIGGLPLPSLAARGDAVRAARREELAAALDPTKGRPLWSDEQIERLANFVRGGSDRDAAAMTIQEIVGRLFYPDYAADRPSWQAAQLIDKFRNGFSPGQILWQITGRLRRAREVLVARARQNRWAMHATAIGMHGIVHALERMRVLRAAPDAGSLSNEGVLGRCLAPPRQVPRTVEAMWSTPAAVERLRPGTIVMFRLEAAATHAPGPEMVFMQGHWNACPAQAFVTALLQAVWRRSLREVGPT